jgi:hypothetical protein
LNRDAHALRSFAVFAEMGSSRMFQAPRSAMEVAERGARQWLGALRSRRLLLAGAAPLCPGGRQALALIREAMTAGGGPVRVLGRPVASRGDLDELAEAGVDFVPARNRPGRHGGGAWRSVSTSAVPATLASFRQIDRAAYHLISAGSSIITGDSRRVN